MHLPPQAPQAERRRRRTRPQPAGPEVRSLRPSGEAGDGRDGDACPRRRAAVPVLDNGPAQQHGAGAQRVPEQLVGDGRGDAGAPGAEVGRAARGDDPQRPGRAVPVQGVPALRPRARGGAEHVRQGQLLRQRRHREPLRQPQGTPRQARQGAGGQGRRDD